MKSNRNYYLAQLSLLDLSVIAYQKIITIFFAVLYLRLIKRYNNF